MSSLKYLYDENHTRYQLVKSQPGQVMVNWLFLPGGPGVDSSCFLDLIKEMQVPGNFWLVDLIFNGSNEPYEFTSHSVYESWGEFLLSAVSKFDNPILVGHSFGGYFPLFFPQLENLLKGFVILNSVPTLNSALFSKYAAEHSLPSLSEATARFINTPTREALKELYLLEALYFFAPQNRAKGIEQIVEKLDFCIPTEHWWYTEGAKTYSEIKWIPEKTPTLIIGGSDDLITPLDIFEQDLRFIRDNIRIMRVPNAGHFPWVEKPDVINEVFASFVRRL